MDTVTLTWGNEPTYQNEFGKPTNRRNAQKVKKETIEYLNLFGIPATDANTKIEQKIGETSPNYTGGRERVYLEEATRDGWYLYNVEYTSEQGNCIAVCSIKYHKNAGVIIHSDSIVFDSGGFIE